jgi:hypothetical protein
MDNYSIAIIAVFALSLIIGYALGFGKVLKFITGGVIGVIISIIICVMFGGIIANIPFVSDMIVRGNAYFGGYAEILAKINVATWIYYVVLFIVLQIVRVIIVKIIAKAFTPQNKNSKFYGARNVINKVFGLLLLGAGCVFFIYLVMAVLALFTDVESVKTMLDTMKNSGKTSVFYLMYSHNPINFATLFARAGEVADNAENAVQSAVQSAAR